MDANDGSDNIMFGELFIDENGRPRIQINKEDKNKFDARPRSSVFILETDKKDETKTESESEEVSLH